MLEGRTYVPLLYLRLAEMTALQHLPDPTKALTLPIIRLRPWLNSKEFKKGIQRIHDAVGARPFGFDLDRDRIGHRSSASFQEFEALFDGSDGHENYYSAVDESGSGLPILRSDGSNIASLRAELDRVRNLERGLFVRVDVSGSQPIRVIAEECLSQNLENVVFILDCGWHSSLLIYQAKCVALLRMLLSKSNQFELVVAGGDFPADGFADKGQHFAIDGEERLLVEAVRREINEAEIIFGDWGSTRLPSTDNEIRRGGRPRIDMPTRQGWECWRKAAPGKSFDEPAIAAATARGLGGSSGLWGEQMIIATRDGQEPFIKGPGTASAARINLHMVLQAHYDEGAGPKLGDELVVNEL